MLQLLGSVDYTAYIFNKHAPIHLRCEAASILATYSELSPDVKHCANVQSVMKLLINTTMNLNYDAWMQDYNKRNDNERVLLWNILALVRLRVIQILMKAYMKLPIGKACQILHFTDVQELKKFIETQKLTDLQIKEETLHLRANK